MNERQPTAIPDEELTSQERAISEAREALAAAQKRVAEAQAEVVACQKTIRDLEQFREIAPTHTADPVVNTPSEDARREQIDIAA